VVLERNRCNIDGDGGLSASSDSSFGINGVVGDGGGCDEDDDVGAPFLKNEKAASDGLLSEQHGSLGSAEAEQNTAASTSFDAATPGMTTTAEIDEVDASHAALLAAAAVGFLAGGAVVALFLSKKS
jgi:hypothetical protein